MKVFQFVGLLVLCSAFYIGGYMSNDGNSHKERENPPEQVDVVRAMVEDYENNPIDAESKYNGKTLIFESTLGYIDTFDQRYGGDVAVNFCFRRPVPSCESGIDVTAYFPNEKS